MFGWEKRHDFIPQRAVNSANTSNSQVRGASCQYQNEIQSEIMDVIRSHSFSLFVQQDSPIFLVYKHVQNILPTCIITDADLDLQRSHPLTIWDFVLYVYRASLRLELHCAPTFTKFSQGSLHFWYLPLNACLTCDLQFRSIWILEHLTGHTTACYSSLCNAQRPHA